MRHRVAHRKLNRTTSHRRALRRALVSSLIEHESIVTTLPKAKEVKAFAEKLITLAKRNTLNNRRRAIAVLNERRVADHDAEHKTVIKKLFENLGPRFVDRPGGYTRIVRLAGRRLGDGSVKAVLQFVDQAIATTGVRGRKTTKAGTSRDSSRKTSEKSQPTEKQNIEDSAAEEQVGQVDNADTSAEKSQGSESEE